MKKMLIVLIIAMVALVLIIPHFLKNEERIVTDIKICDNENAIKNYNVNNKDIEKLNSCFNYTKMYCTNSMPTDKNVLKQIVSDIDSVIFNNIFYFGFKNSKYQERLNLDSSYCGNGGLYGENFLITCYYKEIVIVKLKALLLLSAFDDFHSCFVENYNILYIVKDSFPAIISMDDNISQRDDLINVILNSYDEILSLDLSEQDIYYIATDAMFMASLCENNDGRIKIYNSLREENSVDESTKFLGIENEQLNKKQIYLFTFVQDR